MQSCGQATAGCALGCDRSTLVAQGVFRPHICNGLQGRFCNGPHKGAFFLGALVEQFAWFVDAGYLYAAGGSLCLGVRARGQIDIDFGSVTKMLTLRGRTETQGERHLRTYWYDGARDANPVGPHIAIARQPGVKLRLGRTVPRDNQEGFMQKGVDSLIVRDLMRLSENRAISTAFLLGGDEDLRQGVVEAQEMGVRVVLVGIEPFDEQNQAATLIREADDLIILGQEDLFDHFRLLEFLEPTAGASAGSAYDVGMDYGRAWSSREGVEGVEALELGIRNQGLRRVPPEIDRRLLRSAAASLGGALTEADKIDLRQGFLDGALDSADEGTEE